MPLRPARTHERRRSSSSSTRSDLRHLLEIERGSSARCSTRAYHDTVGALAGALESKDTGTRAHSQRVQRYAVELARERARPSCSNDPSIEYGFLLHDVGKIGDPGQRPPEAGAAVGAERRLIETHTMLGEQMLEGVVVHEGECLSVVRSHHERWDGGGYPDGLARRRDPARRARLRGRRRARRDHERPAVPAAQQPWDAARSTRSPRSPGKQFDPDVVAAFRERDVRACARIRAEIA